jgi:hypothetical protein
MEMLAENYRCAVFVRRDESRVVQLWIREASFTTCRQPLSQLHVGQMLPSWQHKLPLDHSKYGFS